MEDQEVYITEHAYLRMKERMGLSRNAARRMSSRALRKGIDEAGTKGRVHQYLEKKNDHEFTDEMNAKIYGEIMYIFRNNSVNGENEPDVRLITVYPVPTDLRRYVLKAQKER